MSDSLTTDPRRLAAHLRSRLNAEKGSWREIAEAAGLTYSWVTKFGNGELNNPTIGKLQRLYEYFYPGSSEAA